VRIRVFSEETGEWSEREISEPGIVAILEEIVVKSSKEKKKEETVEKLAEKELANERFLTPEQVAERLSLSVRQVTDFAREGIIPSIRYNARVIRFAESALINFIKTGRASK